MGGNRRSALIVDDEVLVATMLGDALESFGFKVTVGHSHPAGLRALEPPAQFDVAFIDLMLGAGPSGADLAARAVALGIPVVAMTGFDALPPGLAGAALLTKPFSLTAVEHVLARIGVG